MTQQFLGPKTVFVLKTLVTATFDLHFHFYDLPPVSANKSNEKTCNLLGRSKHSCKI